MSDTMINYLQWHWNYVWEIATRLTLNPTQTQTYKHNQKPLKILHCENYLALNYLSSTKRMCKNTTYDVTRITIRRHHRVGRGRFRTSHPWPLPTGGSDCDPQSLRCLPSVATPWCSLQVRSVSPRYAREGRGHDDNRCAQYLGNSAIVAAWRIVHGSSITTCACITK